MNEPALKINEQYEISLILPDQVPLVWDKCKRILTRSCKRSGGRVQPNDLYLRCIENQCSLWIIFEPDNNNIIGAAVTQLHNYPSGLRMLNVEHVAGKKYAEWVNDGFATLYRWAKDNKCDGVEAIGRAGFLELDKKEKGWKETSRFYEFKFDKGEQ